MAMPLRAEVLCSTKDMDRVEWLRWRKKGIGSSDAAAVAGVSRWSGPIAVYLDKVQDISPDDETDNEAMQWGTILEDVVASEFARRTGLKVQRRNAILQHPEYAHMLANIDRLIVDPENGWGVLEVKTTGAWNKDEWADGKVPEEVQVQVQHQLAVTGLEYAYVAVLIGGQQYQHARIDRDEEVISALVQIESDFWKLVENRTPPEMDGTGAASDLLAALYPTAEEGEPIELPPTAEQLIAEYQAASADEKAAKARKDAAANGLKSLLGSREQGFCGDRVVSWKQVTSTRFDSKALRKARPDIYQDFCTQSEYRRFTVR